VPEKRCKACGLAFWQGRGRPSAYCAQCRKGNPRYGTAHRARRAEGLAYAWGSPCSRCGLPLLEGQEVHLDHADGGGPDDYRGWSHASCNEAAGARTANRNRGMARHPERYAVPAGAREERAYVPPPGSLPGFPHGPGCRCGESYGQFGVWPSRCW
jgi:hypothetical protein